MTPLLFRHRHGVGRVCEVSMAAYTFRTILSARIVAYTAFPHISQCEHTLHTYELKILGVRVHTGCFIFHVLFVRNNPRPSFRAGPME